MSCNLAALILDGGGSVRTLLSGADDDGSLQNAPEGVSSSATAAYVSAFEDNGAFWGASAALDGGASADVFGPLSGLARVWLSYDGAASLVYYVEIPKEPAGPGTTLSWISPDGGGSAALSSALPGCSDGPAAAAAFAFSPSASSGLATDPAGDAIFLDASGCAVREIDAAHSQVTTLAGGSCNASCSGLTTPCSSTAGSVQLCGPQAIATDPSGTIFVADAPGFGSGSGYTLYRVANGGATALAAVGSDAGQLNPYYVYALAVDASDDLFFAVWTYDYSSAQFTGSTLYLLPAGSSQPLAIAQGSAASPADGALGGAATFGFINGLSLLPTGELLFTDDGAGGGRYQGLREIACR